MSKFELWLLRKLIKEAVRTYAGNTRLFQMIWEATQRRYHEDNTATRLADLQEYLDKQCRQELLLAEKRQGFDHYRNIHNSNPERVLRYGEIPRIVD